jgi:hypothetical protein
MSVFPFYVLWSWACSVLFQLVVLALLLLKGNFRKLPLFTTYIVLNLCQAALIYVMLTYWHPASDSPTNKIVSWASEAATLIVQALATTEVLRLVLNPYRGIWGLAWRILAGISTIVVIFVAIDAARNIDWAIVVADRGYHLTFASAVLAFLHDDLDKYRDPSRLVSEQSIHGTGVAGRDDSVLCCRSSRMGGGSMETSSRGSPSSEYELRFSLSRSFPGD